MVSGPMGAWVTAALAFASVVLGTLSVAVFIEWLRERGRRRGVDEQLRRLSEEGMAVATGGSPLFRKDRESGPTWARTLSDRIPHLKDTELRIEQAALNWSVQTYLLLTAGFALALGVGALIATRSVLLALCAAVVGAFLPTLYLKRQRTKRLHAFEEQLPEAVDLLGRAIRAGHPISAGFKMVSEEAPEPVAGEFRRVFEEQRFGLAFTDSLLGMADRIPLVDVRIFTTAVLIQREVGGNLAEILDKLAEVIRQRFSILRQLRTYTAQGRMSGYILASLPIFLGLVLFLINPENMRNFIHAPLGRILILVALVCQTIGFLWIRKIIQIEI